jgi:hypothetical protein
VQPHDWIDKVNAGSTLASAAAAIVVAVFAYLEIQRNRRQAKVRRRAADLRISDITYALRRRIWNWNGQYPDMPGGAATPAHWAIEIAPDLEAAEPQWSKLVDLLADASPKIGEAVRAAYVKYFKATTNVAEVARLAALPNASTFAGMMQRYANDAHVWFAGCSLDLTNAIDRELNEIEAKVVIADEQRKREQLPTPPRIAEPKPGGD